MDYDNSVAKNNWTGPLVIFNSLKNLLPQHSKILDLGIGTGESAAPFQKAGHIISGVDGSAKMLEQCKKKNIGETLTLVNLEKESLPFSNTLFDAVISNGVFHLIYPLNFIFSEVARVLKPKGYFAFTFENAKEIDSYKEISPGSWENKTTSGVYTYKYNHQIISNLLKKHGCNEIKRTKFLAFQNTELQKDFYFTAVLAQQE